MESGRRQANGEYSVPDGLSEITKELPLIIEMIARTDCWVHPEIFRALPVWCPDTAGGLLSALRSGWAPRPAASAPCLRVCCTKSASISMLAQPIECVAHRRLAQSNAAARAGDAALQHHRIEHD